MNFAGVGVPGIGVPGAIVLGADESCEEVIREP